MSTFDDSDFNDSEEEWDEDLEDTTPMSVREWFWDVFITWGPAIFMVFFIRSSIAEPFPNSKWLNGTDIGYRRPYLGHKIFLWVAYPVDTNPHWLSSST